MGNFAGAKVNVLKLDFCTAHYGYRVAAQSYQVVNVYDSCCFRVSCYCCFGHDFFIISYEFQKTISCYN